MTQRVLVLWFSQSGQARRVTDAFVGPLSDAGFDVSMVEVAPKTPYPFPWKAHQFFGQFPETVLEKPIELAPLSIPPGDWDLVVLAGPIWFLSPSPPFTAFLQSEEASVLAGKRVLTLVACRNLWVSGWRTLVRRIEGHGGRVLDRVVAIHGGKVFASYFTTLFWMLTGKRDAVKVLGKAEIEQRSFDRLAELGALVAERLPGADADASLLGDEATATISYAHGFGEQLMEPVFRVMATVVGAVSRPGSVLRSVGAYWIFSVILSAVVGLILPCTLVRWVLSRWIDPWLDRKGALPVV